MVRTAKDMLEFCGREWLMVVCHADDPSDSMRVRVWASDARCVDGVFQLLVWPVAGKGIAWVDVDDLEKVGA